MRKQEKELTNLKVQGENDEDEDDKFLLTNVVWPKSSHIPIESLAMQSWEMKENDEQAMESEYSEEIESFKQEKRELELIKAEEMRFPWRFLLVTFCFLALILLLSLMRGGRSKSQASFVGVTCGSPGFIVVIVLQFFICITATVASMVWVRREFLRKVKHSYTFVRGDVYFTSAKIIILPICTTVAGFIAGFLGVGAGMILGERESVNV